MYTETIEDIAIRIMSNPDDAVFDTTASYKYLPEAIDYIFGRLGVDGVSMSRMICWKFALNLLKESKAVPGNVALRVVRHLVLKNDFILPTSRYFYTHGIPEQLATLGLLLYRMFKDKSLLNYWVTPADNEAPYALVQAGRAGRAGKKSQPLPLPLFDLLSMPEFRANETSMWVSASYALKLSLPGGVMAAKVMDELDYAIPDVEIDPLGYAGRRSIETLLANLSGLGSMSQTVYDVYSTAIENEVLQETIVLGPFLTAVEAKRIGDFISQAYPMQVEIKRRKREKAPSISQQWVHRILTTDILRYFIPMAIETAQREPTPLSDEFDAAILRVNQNASLKEIKEAFKSAIFATHPDRGGTQEQAIQVMDAYRRMLRRRGVNERAGFAGLEGIFGW